MLGGKRPTTRCKWSWKRLRAKTRANPAIAAVVKVVRERREAVQKGFGRESSVEESCPRKKRRVKDRMSPGCLGRPCIEHVSRSRGEFGQDGKKNRRAGREMIKRRRRKCTREERAKKSDAVQVIRMERGYANVETEKGNRSIWWYSREPTEWRRQARGNVIDRDT